MDQSVKAVKRFWDQNPLWTGESEFEPGSPEFFEEHRNAVVDDCFAGVLDPRTLPPVQSRQQVLDLGCGIGFWTTELSRLGCAEVTGADLSPNSLKLAKQRIDSFGLQAEFKEENAENLSFADNSFSHVNCQGVIHHTPNTRQCISEIHRVLKPGGTASVSVYYKNVFLRAWPLLRPFGKVLTRLGGKLTGRGRENIFSEDDVNEIVRLYDGSENPIGKSYSKKEFLTMTEGTFEVTDCFLHFFPARALPFSISKGLHRWLDRNFGFMIYFNLKKPDHDSGEDLPITD